MLRMTSHGSERGIVFDIQRFSVHDGPGIRTTVFLKGCPLRCLWCHNPESQRVQPVLSFEREICVMCGECVKVCSRNAQSVVDGERVIRRDLCVGCGKCVDACNTNALVLKGKTMTVEEVIREALRDELLYRKSGGGVTISGGEPLMQPTFTFSILRRMKEHNLHTAIETCGYAKWNTFERILEVTDLVIYDLKHMDSVRHKKFVGVGNDLILKNLKNVMKRNKEVLVRIPLIPDINDSDENLRKSAEFIRRLEIERVELIPYHEFAATKYEMLGIDYVLRVLKTYTSEQLEQKRQRLAKLGIKAKIGV
jgi:pyruvate formate lyase activating enzyme